MDGDIVTPDGIVIPASAVTWRFSRGTGPGGQGVNTTDSRVELVVDLTALMATDEVAGQAVTVTPAAPTLAAGQTQQFTATGIDTATAIEAGAFHQCALLQDTTVRCWGLNDYGALGNGAFTGTTTAGSPNPTPVAVVGLTGAVAISGGGYHTCARFPDGTLQCWGLNDGDPNTGARGGGQLGNPATGDLSPTPVPVTGITTATAVTAGGFHTCALLQNGTVQCWGQNDQGQLGNGTTDPAPPTVAPRNATPVTVSDINNAIVIVDKKITDDEMVRLAKAFGRDRMEIKSGGYLNNLELHIDQPID